MKRVLERLNRKLIIDYFNEYEAKYVGKVYIITLTILAVATVLPLFWFSKDVMLSACMFLVCIGASNFITNRKVIERYLKLRQSKGWYRNFKSATLKYRISMLYNGYITKAEFDAFIIYEKIEKAELELIEFEKNEERLKSLAFKELTYSLEVVEELDKMPEEERVKEINRILKREYQTVQPVRV